MGEDGHGCYPSDQCKAIGLTVGPPVKRLTVCILELTLYSTELSARRSSRGQVTATGPNFSIVACLLSGGGGMLLILGILPKDVGMRWRRVSKSQYFMLEESRSLEREVPADVFDSKLEYSLLGYIKQNSTRVDCVEGFDKMDNLVG